MSRSDSALVSAPAYRLGLDIGTNSIGWALLQLEPGDNEVFVPTRIMDSGVRIFEAGVEGNIEQGKDGSRAAARRLARQGRRQNWRRQYRKARLFRLLQKLGLLPPTEVRTADERDAVLRALDAELRGKWCPSDDVNANQKLPFLLRAAGIHSVLSPFEVGRALYHLAQKRGYRANRKTEISDDQERGKVRAGISVLQLALRKTVEDPESTRTLAQAVCDDFRMENGAFALQTEAGDSPTRGRIKGHYTSREMYVDEFCRIRDCQAQGASSLGIAEWEKIEKAIFHQRPLKSQKHLVGRCTLEKDHRGRGRRRCLMAMPEFQEFRLLEKLNHLRVVCPGDSPVPLSVEQREIVIPYLMQHEELVLQPPRRRAGRGMSVSLVSLLDLPRGTQFTAQTFVDDTEDDETTKLLGHSTNARLSSVFGEQWYKFEPSVQERIILQVLIMDDPEALRAWAKRKCNLSDEQAEQFATLHLEDDYGALSRKALRKILPDLRDGMSYSAARKKNYPESFVATPAVDRLLPVTQWNPDIGNPAVIRALSEVRKVVNGIIDVYGKPHEIHVELARELKRSRQERKERWAKDQANMKQRERAAANILEELGLSNPSRSDIDKWLLADECGWRCPYTGKQISPANLANFDIEHIFPRYCLDDSFANKTLCDPDFNRQRKRNRLPIECLSSEEFELVLGRVRQFTGIHNAAKLRRFQAEVIPDDFVSRQLNDTRYNSRLAAEFVGTLYGGRIDALGKQRVVTPTGALTWLLRRGWGLDRILSKTGEKDRDDHRQHAVDAVCVALSSQKVIRTLSDLARRFAQPGARFNEFLNAFADEVPWPHFHDEVQASVLAIIVSHRPNRTVAGPLHAETNYSKRFPRQLDQHKSKTNGKKSTVAFDHHVRKSLDKLKEKEIIGDQIVDPVVRRAVQEKYAELCSNLVSRAAMAPAKLWNDRSLLQNFPRLAPSPRRLRRGEKTEGSFVFSVRVRQDVKPNVVGRGTHQRHVGSGADANFASMVYAVDDANGTEVRWEHEIISRLDAHLRLRQNGGGRKVRRELRKRGILPVEKGGQDMAVPERILFSRTADEIRNMATPPFKVKPGESVRLGCDLQIAL